MKFYFKEEALLQIRRELQGRCLEDIASEIEVSKDTLYRWRREEPQKPSLHIFIKLMNYFGHEISIEEMAKMLTSKSDSK